MPVYNVHYNEGRERYYNLPLLPFEGMRIIPKPVAQLLLHHRAVASGSIPEMPGRVVLLAKKVRKNINSVFFQAELEKGAGPRISSGIRILPVQTL